MDEFIYVDNFFYYQLMELSTDFCLSVIINKFYQKLKRKIKHESIFIDDNECNLIHL